MKGQLKENISASKIDIVDYVCRYKKQISKLICINV